MGAMGPPATFDMLQDLLPQHATVFPVSDLNSPTIVRPDSLDHLLSDYTQQKLFFISNVLGGWLDSLANEEGYHGAHQTPNNSGASTETLTILLSTIDGPLQYLIAKPSALLFISTPNTLPPPLLVPLAQAQGVTPTIDLSTFLLPRILRATASLQTALLLPSTASSTSLKDNRKKLLLKLEELLITIIRVLADGAVRVDWKSARESGGLQGGLGKAREMCKDLFEIVEVLTSSSTSSNPYPLLIPLLYSPTLHSHPPNIFNPTSMSNPPPITSLTSPTPLHSRALLLSLFRILHAAISSTPFLSDLFPRFLEQVCKTWPCFSHTSRTAQGVLKHTLELTNKVFVKPVAGFERVTWIKMGERVFGQVRQRLLGELEGMEVDGDEGAEEEEQVDTLLMVLLEKIWKNSNGTLASLAERLVMELGDIIVENLCSEDGSIEFKICSTLVLGMVIQPPSQIVLSLITSENSLETLKAYCSIRQSLPIEPPSHNPLPDTLLKSLTESWQTITEFLNEKRVIGIETQPSARKRRRDEVILLSGDDGPMGTEGGSTQKKKKVTWINNVKLILKFLKKTEEELRLDDEGLEEMFARLTRSLEDSTNTKEDTTSILKVLGWLSCARDGLLQFPPSTSGDSPSCTLCDLFPSPSSSSQQPPKPPRIFTDAPLKSLERLVDTVLNEGVGGARVEFLNAVRRVFNHCKIDSGILARKLVRKVMRAVCEGKTRDERLAAGNVIVAIVQSYQETCEGSSRFIGDLMKKLDLGLNHKKSEVVETTLIILGRVARMAVPQGLLEGRCLERFVARLASANTYLKSLARTELEQVATWRDVKPYALIQPHFAVIAPLLVQSRQTSTLLSAALDCFHQPRESLLRLTREYTLPTLVLEGDSTLLREIAASSSLTIPVMLTESESASAIFRYLYMKESSTERHKGLGFFMKELKAGSGEGEAKKVTLAQVLNSVRVPLTYKLALEMGDEDAKVQELAVMGLKEAERASKGLGQNGNVEVGLILKESIVGILSFMNRGLNESSAHRPLRDKQKILRTLRAITLKIGAGIAAFSPQIMATLQSALEVEGLRAVTLEAFRSFIVTLKFGEIGPYLGTISATFLRLWPQFSPAERQTATKTLEYILENIEGLHQHVHSIADLSGIPELGKANRRLREVHRAWSFTQRSEHLLARIGSENDVVALQALLELKSLMSTMGPQLQGLSSGDSFDKHVGKLVKALLSAAVKDGPENEQLRNIAFECIGTLGALDPDRFEIPPAEPSMIVMENFESHEESIRFALHLIENLLIGAYRATNDTKHQEFLAYAIQELLGFCGFTAGLVSHDKSASPIDAATRKRWNQWTSLSPHILETCGPLLGGSFVFRERTAPSVAVYPIYSSRPSYRDWIRVWANDLISKLKGDSVRQIFGAFPPVLHLEDITVAQYLLPHLVLNALISGDEADRQLVKREIETVLTDQVSPTHQLSENSRLLSAQTVFDLMDHISRWITHARKNGVEVDQKKKLKPGEIPSTFAWSTAWNKVDMALGGIPQILLGEAALTCKAYARSLLNFESHIVALRRDPSDDAKLQNYYENLHECYAALDEPDGMEGISTKIMSPSILHQIREHESTGRWTSAQSCWEVKLQQTPEDPANHLGLLRCLRNLGHYDSMRTHIVGILHGRNADADWDRILAPFNIEASLIVGDWVAVEETLRIPDIEGPEVAFGRVISAMRRGDAETIAQVCFEGREQLGSPIVAAGRESYRRVYDSVVHLHILRELTDIHHAQRAQPETISPRLLESLKTRFDSTSPSFRAREPILNMRRTAFRLSSTDAARREIADLWLETSKIARKAGHSQTAYSAILQARDLCDPKDPQAPFVFLQNAKLLKAGDQQYKAIQCIDNALQAKIPAAFLTTVNDGNHALVEHLISPGPPTVLAKASLRRARWMHEAGRLEPDEILEKYQEASKLSPDWETPYYYLGHYHDHMADSPSDKGKAPGSHRKSDKGDKGDKGENGKHADERLMSRVQTVKLFSRSLELGTKFIYQAMPRMLTIWLEAGEDPEVLEYVKRHKKDKTLEIPKRSYEQIAAFVQINRLMQKNIRRLAPYQWLTVLPQLVSRILHPNDELVAYLDAILIKVLVTFPHHGFWAMASGAKSQTSKRSKRSLKILDKAKVSGEASLISVDIPALFKEGIHLVDQLLNLCNHHITKTDSLSLRATFPALWHITPTTLIIPLQSSLTVALPSDASHMATHKAFPDRLVVFQKFEDEIVIMTSLQRPRKISIRGDDGVTYSFLCKPKDDLRKDARLMEFNSMIIKLLKKDSDARNRRLTIRTYSVVPLNEECGLIEWVPNVVVLRSILNKLYARHNVPPWSPELKKLFDSIRDPPEKTAEKFDKGVLTKFKPVFHEWFLEAFPEPSAWLRARLAYSRTAAVMSMVGFVLGLGDRHCENILIDGTTGDTVHVDFNCLFDRGRTFDVAEQVPFRLTTNILAGMGVTGVEGVFRRASEISLRILRHNKDSLMSVLETFLHDPLVEWSTKKPRDTPGELALFIRKKARENLDPISNKLRGLQVTSDPATKGDTEVDVGEQVERLIREARSSKNLGSMYVGWAAWF